MRLVILETLAGRVVVYVVLLLAVHLFVGGTSGIGGGFAAGVLTGVAAVLEVVARGRRGRLPVRPATFAAVVASGLGLAIATGLGALAFGLPFLTSAHGYVRLPVVGEVAYKSQILFELGIYAVVVGGLLLVVRAFVEGE